MLSSLRTRILFLTTAILVLALGATGTATYLIVRTHSMQAILQNLNATAGGHALAIDEWVAARAAAVAAAVEAVKTGDRQAAIKQLQQSGGFQVGTLGLADRSAYTSSAAGLPPSFDPTARPWYKETLQAGKAIVTKPYADIVSGKPMVSFTAPLMEGSTVAGVVSAAVLLDGVRRVVSSVHPTPSSFGFVVDGEGNILSHPDENLLRKPIGTLSSTLDANSARTLAQAEEPMEVELNGEPKLLLGKPINGTSWTLLVALDKTEATAGMRSVLRTAVIALLLAGVLAAISVGVLTTRAFQRLSRVRDAMTEVSSGSGDLTLRLPEDGSDEVTQISRSFNQFVGKITAILLDIRNSSDTVKVSSSEIATGNQDLSARTEQQAGSLEETASAMEQLTSTVKQNSDNARRANELATTASNIAAQGGEVVCNVVATMDAINASSQKIADIISVIDGIAFQTNILALNAAVEAARAGEQGRGFAVVASEVRSLAQRSAQAAKEIKDLIDSSVANVTEGGVLVAKAGQTMDEIVSSIRNVNVIVGEIATASIEQSAGIDEVNLAITHIDEGTQQNAALVEQAAAAAQSLQDEAARLATIVGGFKMR